jgi:hypothetical protein
MEIEIKMVRQTFAIISLPRLIRLVPKVIFFKEKSGQVTLKSSHDFDFFLNPKNLMSIMSIFKGHPENTFRRFLQVSKGYLINILHFCHSFWLLEPFFEPK